MPPSPIAPTVQQEAALRRRLKRSPHDREALLALGQLAFARGDHPVAARHFNLLCSLAPQEPERWLALTELWLSAGQVQRAIETARQGLARGADKVLSRCLLAQALETAGERREALARWQEVTELAPAVPAPWVNLGALLRTEGRSREAITALEHALTLEPGLASAHNNLANAWKDLHAYEEALACNAAALAAGGPGAVLHFNRGLLLMQLTRHDEALQAFAQSLAEDPAQETVRVQQLEALISLGRFADARAQAEALLATAPRCARALYLLAQITRDTDAPELRPRLQALRADPTLAAGDACHLDYALGKLADEAGESENAFGCFQRANGYDRARWSGTARRQTARLMHAMRAIPVARWHAWHLEETTGPQPIFIVGMPRSGTTLLEQQLARHPAISPAGEVDYLPHALQREAGVLPTQTKPEEWLAALDAPIALRARSRYLARIAALGCGATPWFTDKTPFNCQLLGLIHQLWPRARVLYCTRDARDTGLSLYSQQFDGLAFANDLHDITATLEACTALMRHWEEALPGLALFNVPYAKLVTATETLLAEVLEFIGLESSTLGAPDSCEANTIQTASRWQARQAVYTRSLGRWRQYRAWLGPLLTLED